MLDEFAKRSPEVLKRLTELKQFANLRNVIVHWSGHVGEGPIAEPHEDIVREYESLVHRVLNPLKAMDRAVKGDDIYKTSCDSAAADVIREMHSKVYTHVPVTDENNRLLGVFSENAIVSYLAHHKTVTIDSGTRIGEFRDFIRLGSHRSEVFDFMGPDALLIDVARKFQENLKNKKRIGALFVTSGGTSEEVVLGLITAWDVAGVTELTF